jgi:ABC-type multidrug transport system ATPase subunit
VPSKGEIVSLIGPNGAGKTTFASTASGIVESEGDLGGRGGREVVEELRGEE